MHTKKGFTLIELLVVIAIVAILSVVVILTLNPAELLKQARDSNRISDLGTLKSALSVYLADVTSPTIAPSYTTCYLSVVVANNPPGVCNGLFSAAIASLGNVVLANLRKVDANGWLPVNFNQISSGSPLGNLPVDPVNNATYFYAYVASSTLVFEIDAGAMESVKYKAGGSSDIVGNDGGNAATAYEVGTAPGLAL